jgi:outer membrane protein TolC
MKHFIAFSIACLLCKFLSAQVITPDKMSTTASGIRDRLVELALQNPDLEVEDHEVKIAKYNLSAAKGWWAENFSFSFNANEYSLKTIGKPANDNTHYYTLYPLYNMGINIPIGGIFSKPQAVKAARERVAIAENQRTIKYREIRVAVLTAYQNYLSSKELYTVESQLTESAYSDFLQSKEKFRNGEISVNDYNEATDRYQNALKARISAENSFKLTQIQLEALIGVPLSTVLPNNTTQSQANSTSE